MRKIQGQIDQRLGELGIQHTVYGRMKHPYSIYRKMFNQNKSLDEIFDLFAFRVIVESVGDCYNVLGVIHDIYKPILGRFKDYIGTPKPNGYQSLHTTVMLDRGETIHIPKFEFARQLRSAVNTRPLQLGKDELAIFEGIHALNDVITGKNPKAFKLYIAARSNITDGEGGTVFEHVFGTVDVHGSSDEVIVNWEALKRREKGQSSTADAVEAVAHTLPGLWRAEKMQSKAAKAGFEWSDKLSALDKLEEETAELRRAVESGDSVDAPHGVREEVGDVLFMLFWEAFSMATHTS